MKPFSQAFYDSPLGTLEINANQNGITALLFSKDGHKSQRENEHTLACKKQLDAYFSGTRKTFELPLHFQTTPFRHNVWQALLNIPYGHTCSYKHLANDIGNAKASRAVGGACHHNPICIIIPCHRVVGHNMSLTGYAGGLEKKQWLLHHEAASG